MTTTIDPFKQTLSSGFAFRQAAEGSPKPIITVGMWLLFLPGLFALPMYFLQRGDTKLASALGCTAVCGAILYRTTLNGVRARRKCNEPADAE